MIIQEFRCHICKGMLAFEAEYDNYALWHCAECGVMYEEAPRGVLTLLDKIDDSEDSESEEQA